MTSLLQSMLYLVFPAIMAWTAISDIATMTISNRVSLLLAASFFVIAPIYGFPLEALGTHLLAGLLVLGVGIVFFSRGWIGGGDAKMAAAAAIWLGFDQLMPFVVASAVFGGVLTLMILILRRQTLPAFALQQDWLTRLHDRSEGVPYGVAIAAGGLFVFPATPFVQLALGG
ncbi:A24 family peptidase [Kaistia algarum]|uniref:A24 family peptidase n=1 Tax=Kaistia algarum TaxID=2083279 RepID=UPI002258F4C1|nr:prepilin peptidase [Kaistia algarum]MCX5516653.1 prepilin peptidase [Kaistia algarum]